jgi:hypothetical protein
MPCSAAYSFRRLLPALLLAACAGLLLPARGEAQLGGFLKKKLRDKVSSSGETAASTTSGPRFGGEVLEMTPAVLDRLDAALAAEKAGLDDLARQRAAVKSPEEYEQCSATTLVSPEMQRMMESAGDDMSKVAAAGERAQAMVLEKCGVDPAEFNENRIGEMRRAAHAKGVAAGAFESRQMEILSERVLPFCAAGGTELRIPGSGKDIFYVYSEVEMKALAPRCDALTAAIRAVE